MRYNVRSRYLIDVVKDIQSGKLILSPFFQRKLVWRISHKIDFIKTILLQYPFPEIFISRGTIDVEKMESTSCVVDGQQRLNSILEFILGTYTVDGKYFNDLSPKEKEDFFKYEIAIIDLDLSNNDPKIVEIFQRLNRTFYALSTVEKLINEYNSTEYLMVSKVMCKEFISHEEADEDTAALYSKDPNISMEFIDWAEKQKVDNVYELICSKGVFSAYQLTRSVHILFILNITSTCIEGFFNRNDLTLTFLEQYSENFPFKDEVVKKIEKIAAFILKMKFKEKSYWLNKSNLFSLIVLFYKEFDTIIKKSPIDIKEKLVGFEKSLPAEYRISAKEGVNNRKERIIRNDYLKNLIL